MGILLLIPFFLIRFGLLAVLNKDAVRRAARFAPMERRERPAYWAYQLSNAAILLSLFFLTPQTAPPALFWAGAAVYGLGTILLAIAMVNFAAPAADGMNKRGLYRVSRNPMYLAYFLFFLGCALLTQSPVLLGFVLVFQISAHWIILAEERWCIQTFGQAYLDYMHNVRRYL